mmetsp:Transcript_45049/g.70620  ORF Transcript_45049/g.70620 Transcript_45049/m.70620 type:complete len:81 (-) Transcript_45049:122-364(-)
MSADPSEELEECMLVMQPCDADEAGAESECLCVDEEKLEACIELSEASILSTIAKLNNEDSTEDLLNQQFSRDWVLRFRV